MDNNALKKNKMIYWNCGVDRAILETVGFNNKNYLMRYVHKNMISLNISKQDGILKIDVLDEDFLQPYDYQYVLKKNPNHTVARAVKDSVDSELCKIQDYGIIRGFDSANYVYSKYSQDECWN